MPKEIKKRTGCESRYEAGCMENIAMGGTGGEQMKEQQTQ